MFICKIYVLSRMEFSKNNNDIIMSDSYLGWNNILIYDGSWILYSIVI